MLSIFDSAALLLSLSALFGWFNRRFIRLPHTIGLLVTGLLVSLLVIGLEVVFPSLGLHEALSRTLLGVDFTDVLMNGMLAFLLFAGALEVNVEALRRRAIPIAILALAGTLISTAVVGLAFWGVSQALGLAVPLPWALVFGALISPTDPVAVMATMKTVKVPAALEAEVQGESLFNDGVGVVLFTVLVGFAIGPEHGGGEEGIVGLVAVEVGGGILLGVCTGWLAFLALRSIDDFAVEVLITLALVAGTYAAAQHLGMSGPLAVVAAGLLIGDRGPRYAMSQRTEHYVSALWTLIDEILNSVLFLLIGLEVLVLRIGESSLVQAAAAIPIVLVARLLSVSAPLVLLPLTDMLSARNVPFLTWAGVRGGISIALALSLPDHPAKPAILAATYAVVLFTVLVQATTLGWVARRTVRGEVEPVVR